MRTIHSYVLLLSLFSSLAACGGSQPAPAAPQQPATPAAPTAPTTPDVSAAAVPDVWSASMTKEQKLAFMKAKVAPRMAKVFQEADAAHYANFNCKSCHGPEFKLPKDFLPKLTLKDGKITAFADKPQVSKFMAERVVPEMATALGVKPYDPKTKEGFGCGGCHAIEMK